MSAEAEIFAHLQRARIYKLHLNHRQTLHNRISCSNNKDHECLQDVFDTRSGRSRMENKMQITKLKFYIVFS